MTCRSRSGDWRTRSTSSSQRRKVAWTKLAVVKSHSALNFRFRESDHS
jgi:hypothetical protein